MEKRNIVLVDDHTVVRKGMKELIEKLGPYTIQAEFDNGLAFLNAFPLHPEPDLILLDLTMPEMNGEEVVELLKKEAITIPILMLTLNSEEATVIRLFRNGIRGYLTKDCRAESLQSALEAIFKTGYYHNEFLTLSLHNEPGASAETDQQKIVRQLTARECEFLKWVCHENELTYEQIADKMCVSKRTVDGYREALFEKFGIKSKTGLVLFVLKYQLFEWL